jgi:Flp pilus assembly protein TadD
LHDAEFQFREAIRTSPSDTEARFNLVRVLEQLGEHEAAETERAEALRLKSKIASESP